MRIRPPAVAGRFYPRDERLLAADVQAYLHAPAPRPQVPPRPGARLRALVVPHAGYVYSGPTAGVAYRLLTALRSTLRRVVLLGPAHYVPVAGLALSSADAWQTPLGTVPVDTEARDAILRDASPGARLDDRAHAPEHSLEVQVPFLQSVAPEAAIVPVLVGADDSQRVSRALRPWWDDPQTLILVSSDLSHYHPDAVARRLDEHTAEAVCRADADAVGDTDACGCRPLRAVLRLARDRDASVRLLDLRTSADTAGEPDRVVGYGAFAMEA